MMNKTNELGIVAAGAINLELMMKRIEPEVAVDMIARQEFSKNKKINDLLSILQERRKHARDILVERCNDIEIAIVKYQSLSSAKKEELLAILNSSAERGKRSKTAYHKSKKAARALAASFGLSITNISDLRNVVNGVNLYSKAFY